MLSICKAHDWYTNTNLAFQIKSISETLPSVVVLPTTGASPLEVRDPALAIRKLLVNCYPALVNLWADSGDSVSLLYAGTRALKADVTRNGKRTMKGYVDDGMNALTRYYLNNFADGIKLDSYDLWSGKYDPNILLEVEENLKSVRQSQIGELIQPLQLARQMYVPDGRVHVDQLGRPHTYIGLLVVCIKLYAPRRITSVLEFVLAMILFLYILLFVKVFRIDGKAIATRGRLTKAVH